MSAEIEERFSNALHSTARAWRLAVDRRLKDLGVSQASWLTIAVAAKAREPLSQIELAHRLGIEGATMVAVIDRLGEPSATDRRVKRVVLTKDGMRLYRKVKAEADAFRSELLAKVDAKKLAM